MRFTSGDRDRYDLVVGADGMHSATRRMIFGPEQQYLRHLGFYVALAQLPDRTETGSANPMYNFPGHLAGIVDYHHKSLTVLMFRSPWIDYDYHDLAAQKQILADAFAGHAGWKVPELIDAARRDPELYFDSVSQIEMPSWHDGQGRVGGRRGCLRIPVVRPRHQPRDHRNLVACTGIERSPGRPGSCVHPIRARSAPARHLCAGHRRTRR